MDTRRERAYQKHAWLIFFVFGVTASIAGLTILAGVFQVDPPSAERTTGLTLGQIAARVPGMDTYVSGLTRQLGNITLTMGVLLAGIAAVPFRRGERWAWYACLSLPVLVAVQFTNSFAIYHFASGGFGWQLDLASLVVVLTGLLASYRTFFPRPLPG